MFLEIITKVERRMTKYERRIQRLKAQGRGTGHCEDYKPWLTPQDFSSTGI